jgi:hypothetical protein
MVIFHEKSWKPSKENPTRLRYGFATLFLHGKPRVLSAPDLAHAHEPPLQAAELVRKCEQDSLRVCEDLDKDQKRRAKAIAMSMGLRRTRVPTEEDLKPGPDETCDLRLEVSSAAGVDELFAALGKGRMVGQESSPALPEWMQSRSDDA